MKTYFKNLSSKQKRALAAELKTSVPYLSQVAHGHRLAGHRFAKKIQKVTDGEVTINDLRPDIFGPAPERVQTA